MTERYRSSDAATPLPAILYILATGVLFACMDTGAKYLVLSGTSPLFVAWTRFLVHVLFITVLFRGWKNPAMLRANSLARQVLRGVFLFGSTIFNFIALNTLQLAETTSIFFFAPMVITALAGPLLGEWAGWRRWVAIGAGLVGVLVITRPGLVAFQIGHVYALCATFSYCFYVIMTRHMAGTETAESLIFYSALAPVVLLLPVVPFTISLPHDPVHWVVLLALGFFGGLGHWLLINAYRQATATALAPYPYMQMVWMIGFGWLIFGQLPDRWTVLGAGIIVASGLYIVHRERQLRLKHGAGPNVDAAELAEKL